jgi:hypothetical protein
MAKEEIEAAKEALRAFLIEHAGSDLPEMIAALGPRGYREDALRVAFWFLIGEGTFTLNREFQPVLTPMGAGA